MLIGPEGFETSSCIGGGCSIFESSNNVASSFMVSNYESLERVAEGMNIDKEKASDLVHDVFISIVKSERNGEGYNPDYIGVDSVEKFIYGRMKAYSKRPEYSKEFVEKVRISGSVNKEPVYAYSIASSFDDRSNGDEYDSFQLAYMNASVASNTEELVNNYSIEEQFNYLLDVCAKYNIKIVNVLRNIDKISQMLNSSKLYKKGMEALRELRDALNYNDEAKEALTSVLEFSKKNKDAFEMLISKY